MFKGSLLFACFTALVMLLSPLVSCESYCEPSSCGNIHNIRFPFRLKGSPPHCGLKKFELSCDENNRTILQLYSGRFYVMAINYTSSIVRVVDPGIQKDNCSAWPLYSLTQYNFINNSDPYHLYGGNTAYTFVKCATQVNSTRYIDTTVCNNENTPLSSPLLQRHTYVVGDMTASDVEDSCNIGVIMWASNPWPEVNYTSFRSIHDALVYGFELYWHHEGQWTGCNIEYKLRMYCYSNYNCFSRTLPFFNRSSFGCIWAVLQMSQFYSYVCRLIALVVAARALCGIPFFFAFLVYKWRRRHLSMYASIEDFIQSHNNLTPVRYSYSDIKKMTKGFEDKLGEGGYGCVYKGKLRSSHLVAVKILGKSKANGQDFINEVATIGRIHHVNVVQLIGFCIERSTHAIVYEFMPNGSLEKYIYLQEKGNFFLSCGKLYEISLGIARGIEYLHGGCDMQILYFDIKPHNILLDENFVPKVSDFGLARLYPTDNSTVSLTAARGTLGYIAPELFYKNIGGISCKADVYSFGKLLMEMVGKRKNANAYADHSSEMYFPTWIYDRLNQGEDIELNNATEDDKIFMRKMVIVGLRCIQMNPVDRSSMSKVLEMLEGDVELLRMPPKPFLYPQDMSNVVQEDNKNPAEALASSLNAMDTITLDGR